MVCVHALGITLLVLCSEARENAAAADAALKQLQQQQRQLEETLREHQEREAANKQLVRVPCKCNAAAVAAVAAVARQPRQQQQQQ